MEIILNGEVIETQQTKLSELVLEQDLEAAVVATALNGEFVAASERPSTLLTTRCEVEIVAPMQGG